MLDVQEYLRILTVSETRGAGFGAVGVSGAALQFVNLGKIEPGLPVIRRQLNCPLLELRSTLCIADGLPRLRPTSCQVIRKGASAGRVLVIRRGAPFSLIEGFQRVLRMTGIERVISQLQQCCRRIGLKLRRLFSGCNCVARAPLPLVKVG